MGGLESSSDRFVVELALCERSAEVQRSTGSSSSFPSHSHGADFSQYSLGGIPRKSTQKTLTKIKFLQFAMTEIKITEDQPTGQPENDPNLIDEAEEQELSSNSSIPSPKKALASTQKGVSPRRKTRSSHRRSRRNDSRMSVSVGIPGDLRDTVLGRNKSLSRAESSKRAISQPLNQIQAPEVGFLLRRMEEQDQRIQLLMEEQELRVQEETRLRKKLQREQSNS